MESPKDSCAFMFGGQVYAAASTMSSKIESLQAMSGDATAYRNVKEVFRGSGIHLDGLEPGVLEEAIRRQPEMYQESLAIVLLPTPPRTPGVAAPARVLPKPKIAWPRTTLQTSPRTPSPSPKTRAPALLVTPKQRKPLATTPRTPKKRRDSLIDGTCLDPTPSRSQQRGPRKSRAVLKPDAKTEFLDSEIKQWRVMNRSAITRRPLFLPKNKVLLNLLQRQSEGRFVEDVMGKGRMQGWAPELREAFTRI